MQCHNNNIQCHHPKAYDFYILGTRFLFSNDKLQELLGVNENGLYQDTNDEGLQQELRDKQDPTCVIMKVILKLQNWFNFKRWSTNKLNKG